MRDDLLEEKLADAKRRNRPAAEAVLMEAADRIEGSPLLPANTARAVAHALRREAKGPRAAAFLSREPKKIGRPPGSPNKKQPPLKSQIGNIFAAMGETPVHATQSDRSRQRLKREIDGSTPPGKSKK